MGLTGMVWVAIDLSTGAMERPVPIQLQKAWREAWPFGVHARHRFQNSPPGSDGDRPGVHTTRSAPAPSALISPNNLHPSILGGHPSSDHFATLKYTVALPLHTSHTLGHVLDSQSGERKDSGRTGPHWRLQKRKKSMLGIRQPHPASGVPVKKAGHPSQGRGTRLQNYCPLSSSEPRKPGQPRTHLTSTRDPRCATEPTLDRITSLPAQGVHTPLVCHQGSRLEQGRTPGLKRQAGQAESLQQGPLLFWKPSLYRPATPLAPHSATLKKVPSTRPQRKAPDPQNPLPPPAQPQSSSMCGGHGFPSAGHRQAPEPLWGKHISRGHLRRAQPGGGCCTSPHLRIHSKRLRCSYGARGPPRAEGDL